MVFAQAPSLSVGRVLFRFFARPVPLSLFGLLVPRIPHQSSSTPHTVQLSSSFVSLSLQKSASKPIQARLRLRACKQRYSAVGRNSLLSASTLFFRYRLPSSSVAATSCPRNPNKVLPLVAFFFIGGPPPLVVRLACYPLCRCAPFRGLFLLPSVAQKAHRNSACVPPTLFAFCSCSLWSRKQNTTLPHNRGRPRPSVNYGALGLPRLRGTRRGSLIGAAPSVPSFPARHSPPLRYGLILGFLSIDLVLFLIFFGIF